MYVRRLRSLPPSLSLPSPPTASSLVRRVPVTPAACVRRRMSEYEYQDPEFADITAEFCSTPVSTARSAC